MVCGKVKAKPYRVLAYDRFSSKSGPKKAFALNPLPLAYDPRLSCGAQIGFADAVS